MVKYMAEIHVGKWKYKLKLRDKFQELGLSNIS